MSDALREACDATIIRDARRAELLDAAREAVEAWLWACGTVPDEALIDRRLAQLLRDGRLEEGS